MFKKLNQDKQRLHICVPQSAGLVSGDVSLREGTGAVVFNSGQTKLGSAS